MPDRLPSPANGSCLPRRVAHSATANPWPVRFQDDRALHAAREVRSRCGVSQAGMPGLHPLSWEKRPTLRVGCRSDRGSGRESSCGWGAEYVEERSLSPQPVLRSPACGTDGGPSLARERERLRLRETRQRGSFFVSASSTAVFWGERRAHKKSLGPRSQALRNNKTSDAYSVWPCADSEQVGEASMLAPIAYVPPAGSGGITLFFR